MALLPFQNRPVQNGPAQNRPTIMGILNMTPDSFSDDGHHFGRLDLVMARVRTMLQDGADIIDVGGESSRPGARPVSLEEEWERIEGVVKELGRAGICFSVDTYKPEVMLRSAEAGASYINDISGTRFLSSADLKALAAFPKLGYIAMHMQGMPQTMQESALQAPEAVERVSDFLATCATRLGEAGFEAERIVLDPGIGFGKTDAANMKLLEWCMTAQSRRTARLLVGVSRKGWIGRALEIPKPEDRDPATKMLEFALMLAGVDIIRTHSVGPLHRMRKTLNTR